MGSIEHELTQLLNKYNQDNVSSSPDWLLAQFLLSCLAAFNIAVQQRETWYGRDPRPSVLTAVGSEDDEDDDR
jgi:hypothetical protein